ncbi:Rpn family recombination-promoting nuclease/putative transposase [Lachnospiraceae bacterium ZAX-1]
MSKEIDVEKIGLDNDYLFSAVMSDGNICKTFLEGLLKIEIDRIEVLDSQKTFNNGLDIKGVRLDIYVKDGKGTVYDIEMQVSREKDISKRMRYYQSVMDEDLLKKGMFYEDLPNSFIIFICTWDYVGLGEGIYIFKNMLEGKPEHQLDDGTTRIILNTEGSRSGLNQNVVDFLNYIQSGTVSGDWIRVVDEKVRLLKSNKKWRADYMTWMMHEEELKREGIREGIREGEQRGLMKALQKLASKGKTVEEIADLYDMTIDEVNDYLEVQPLSRA